MMSDQYSQKITFEELCQCVEVSQEALLEIVEQGIVEPDGDAPEQWIFTTHMVTVTKKAIRLNRDLGIDWPGIALAIRLIEELEQLRDENSRLKQLLGRFRTH